MVMFSFVKHAARGFRRAVTQYAFAVVIAALSLSIVTKAEESPEARGRVKKPMFNNTAPFIPSEILKAYNYNNIPVGPKTPLPTGVNQEIAIITDGIPDINDLGLFRTQCNIVQAVPTVTVYGVDSTGQPLTLTANPNAPANNATLEMEWTSGIAPDAVISIYVVDTSAVGGVSAINGFLSMHDALVQIDKDTDPKTGKHPNIHQVAIGLEYPEVSAVTANISSACAPLFDKLTNQRRITFFAATGDKGGGGQPLYPATDLNVIAVGGTTLTLDPVTGVITNETGWLSSGGGSSIRVSRPTWQTGVGIPQGANKVIPDVSIVGDNTILVPDSNGPLAIVNGNQVLHIGGTRWSSAMWAGLCAVINQAKTDRGFDPTDTISPLGPNIYPLILNPAFFDITTGTNGKFKAGTGYDQVTGIGTPNIPILIEALTKKPAPFPITINTNVNTDPSSDVHYSPSIAINPANSKNAVCCSSLDRGGISIAVSTNRGGSWASPTGANGQKRIAAGADAFPTASQTASPACAFDYYGNCYIAYQDVASEIVVLMSSNGGQTFNLAKVFPNTLGALSQPRLAAGFTATKLFRDKGVQDVWVSFIQKGAGGVSIMAAGSTVNCLDPVLPMFASGSQVAASNVSVTCVLGDIGVGPNGESAISYQDGTQISTVVNQSNGVPGPFGAPLPVATTSVTCPFLPAPANANLKFAAPNGLPSSSPSIAFDRSDTLFSGATLVGNGKTKKTPGRLYMAFTSLQGQKTSDDTNVVFTYSDDLGNSWVTPYIVNDGNQVVGRTGSTSQFLPRIAVDPTTGYVVVSYYDCRRDLGVVGSGSTDTIENNETNFYANVSLDGGTTMFPVIFSPQIDSVANQAVTQTLNSVRVTTTGKHYFAPRTLVEISGVVDATGKLIPEYNGIFVVDSVPQANVFTFTSTNLFNGAAPIGGSPPNGTQPAIAAATLKLSSGTTNAYRSNAKSLNPTADFGEYSGLAFYDGSFISAWCDNSNSALNTPVDSLDKMQIYTCTATVSPFPGVAPSKSSKADLFVSSIDSYSPSDRGDKNLKQYASNLLTQPYVGHPFVLAVTITNQGAGDAGPFYVSAFADPKFVGYGIKTQTDFAYPDPSNPNKVDSRFIAGIPAGTSTIVLLTMEYDTAGDHTVAILVDSQGTNVDSNGNITSQGDVAESDETNNLATQRIFVYSQGLDIAVRQWVDQSVTPVVPYAQFTANQTGIAPLNKSNLPATGATLTINTSTVKMITTTPIPSTVTKVTVSGVVDSTGILNKNFNGTFTITSLVNTATNSTFTYDVSSISGLATVTAIGGGGVVSYDPSPGINAHFDLTIVNTGNRDMGSFKVYFYSNRINPPSQNDDPDVNSDPKPITVNAGLAVGNFTTLTFDLIPQNTPRGGRAWVFANRDNVNTEVNAVNNIASVTWGVPNDPPAINSSMTANPTSANVGDTISFVVGAADPNGDQLFYLWDFGDGNTAYTKEDHVTHVYSAPGKYAVTVTVSDGPFNARTSSAFVSIFDSTTVDLGFVIAKSGYISLKVPSPFGTARTPILNTTQVDNMVTVTTSKAHGLAVGQPITISGVNVKKYNGKVTVASVPSSTTFTYATKPGLPDGAGGFVIPGRIKAQATIVETTPAGQNIKMKNQVVSGNPATTPSFVIAKSPNGATESGTTATIVTTTPIPNLKVGGGVSISGVEVVGYNGSFVVTSVTTTATNSTFTYTPAKVGLLPSGSGTTDATVSPDTGYSFTVEYLGPNGLLKRIRYTYVVKFR